MIEPVHLGIDWSEGGYRAVYLDDQRAISLSLPMVMQSSLVTFDPESNISSIGVGFPSLVHFVGTQRKVRMQAIHGTRLLNRVESPESITSRYLAWISRAVGKATDRPIGATVLAVPASLGHTGRQALLACAREAGLERVSLLDRCTAAALGYHAAGHEKSITVLVFDLDYGDCEYAVVRLARGRCRVVAAGSVPRVSGQMLDALLIEAIVLALREERIFLGLKQMSAENWLEFRAIANLARHDLAKWPETEVVLHPWLTGLASPHHVHLHRDSFEAKAQPMIGQSIDSVQSILEQTGLELDDIDAFLTVGWEAQNHPVRDLLCRAFRDMPTRTELDLVATGAAWHARQTADDVTALAPSEIVAASETNPAEQTSSRPGGSALSEVILAPDDRPEPAESEIQAVDSVEDSTIAEVIGTNHLVEPTSSMPSCPTSPLSEEASVPAARRLIEQGRLREAEAVLDTVFREAETLREELRKAATAGWPTMLQQARALLDAGDYVNAVKIAHEGFEQSPDDPTAFREMLNIHVEAGQKLDQPADYSTATSILDCAQSHDQTNPSIRNALGRRHYQHALAMRVRNRPTEALEATREALTFDPKHPEANRLFEELTAQELLGETKGQAQ